MGGEGVPPVSLSGLRHSHQLLRLTDKNTLGVFFWRSVAYSIEGSRRKVKTAGELNQDLEEQGTH